MFRVVELFAGVGGFRLGLEASGPWDVLYSNQWEGFTYEYSEGAIPFPDPLDRPSRTILTTEGGRNRASHVVLDKETMAFRTLMETECERLMGFPDGWTNTGMPKGTRYFCMGNAVVVGLVEMIGRELVNRRS